MKRAGNLIRWPFLIVESIGGGDGDTSIDRIAEPIGWKLFLRSIASICRGNLNGERTGDSSLSRNLEPRCKSNSGVKVADREREETCIKPFRYRLLNGAAFLLISYISKGGFDFKRNFKFKRGRGETKYKWTKTYHGWILRGSDLLRVNY